MCEGWLREQSNKNILKICVTPAFNQPTAHIRHNVMGSTLMPCQIYTPQKMFLLTFSFANFETTRGIRGKANILFLYLLSST